MAKAVKETFVEFQEYIMQIFTHKFPPKGTGFIFLNAFDTYKEKCRQEGKSIDRAGEQMLLQYDYTPEREEFLITNTKFYIKHILRNVDQSHTFSPLFLEKLTNKISEMFSYYIMHKYQIPENGKSRNKFRLKVREEIKKILFDNNSYIAQLQESQKQNRELRQKPKSERKQIAREKQRNAAQTAYNYTKQINSIFLDAQNTPRKMR